MREKKLCSVELCENLSAASGYCAKHYRRLLRHGRTNTLREAAETKMERGTVPTLGTCPNCRCRIRLRRRPKTQMMARNSPTTTWG